MVRELKIFFDREERISKVIFSCLIIVAFILILSPSTYTSYIRAQGSGYGGGGGGLTCKEDIWSCTDWSQCSRDGRQTRVCTLSFECYSAFTPKPDESKSCIPSTTPPTPSPVQVMPEEIKSVASSCTKDTWTCSAWSKSCDIYGKQNRTCQLYFDCPGIKTPIPECSRACQDLQCGDDLNLRQRIYCRLNLTKEQLAREFEIRYLPEGCRGQTGESQKECINTYKLFNLCWDKKTVDERFACAESILKFEPLTLDNKIPCQDKEGDDKVLCKQDIRKKVLYMIMFRFHNLETRAEELATRGVDLRTIADFETIVESKKQELFLVVTNNELYRIIIDVRKSWEYFVNQAKDQISL